MSVSCTQQIQEDDIIRLFYKSPCIKESKSVKFNYENLNFPDVSRCAIITPTACV